MADVTVDSVLGPNSHVKDRLRCWLALHGLVLDDVVGDGNCQFYALQKQLSERYQVKVSAVDLRHKAVDWLRDNPNTRISLDDGPSMLELFQQIHPVDERTWERYLEDMYKHENLGLESWGDVITLYAVSALHHVRIFCLAAGDRSEFCQVIYCKTKQDSPLPRHIYVGTDGSHFVSTKGPYEWAQILTLPPGESTHPVIKSLTERRQYAIDAATARARNHVGTIMRSV